MKKKKKGTGPFAGLIIIVLGIGILWWNEGNDVKNIKTIEEARNVLVKVSSDKVDPVNEGKLVSTNGKMVIEEDYLQDSMFNLQSPKTAKLVRVVEMYQWVEEEEDDGDYVRYNYKKEWLTEIESSSSFNDSTKVNPSSMPYEQEVFLSNNVSLGAFTLSDAQKEMLDTSATVSLGDTVSIPAGYFKVGNYISSVDNLANADIGDVRISFRYNSDQEISILAKQSGSSFVPYESNQGKILFRVEKGIMSGDDIINVVESENNALKWILRILGILFNVVGFAALLSPVAFLVKWIPLLGNGIARFIKGIGALVGLGVSFVVIAISWIFYRPLVGILLLGGTVLVGILIAMLIKKSRAVEAPEAMPAAVAGVPGMTMQVPNNNVAQPVQQPVMPQQPIMPQQPVMQQQPVMSQQPVMQQPQQNPMSNFEQNNNQQ